MTSENIKELAIGRSSYKIECQKDDLEKLSRLAARVNERVNRLAISLRNIDEKTLLVIAAIGIEEELENIRANSLNTNHPSCKLDERMSDENDDLNKQDIYDAVSENMENISDYIERLTEKIRSY